jgi:hypothetical protein
LRKFDDLLGHELGSRVRAIDNLQFAQRVFERRDHHRDRVRSEGMVLQQAMNGHRIGSLEISMDGWEPSGLPHHRLPFHGR